MVTVAIAGVGLSGCQYFSWLHPRPKAKAIAVRVAPTTLAPAGPNALLDRLYADAVQEMQRRDYATALDLLQMARARKTDDPRVLTAMGVIYDKLGRFDLSDRYYTLAEAADPGSKVVAMDRAYSERLQRAEAESATEADGAEAARLARIESARPITALTQLDTAETRAEGPGADPLRLPHIELSAALKSGVEVRDATGLSGGADPIKSRLAHAGWSLDHLPLRARMTSAVSRIVYPEDYARVARALARTLPTPATLQACGACLRLEVIVGRDTLAKAAPARVAEVRRA
jgi:tetratricopeptide (TPR) repeat protein